MAYRVVLLQLLLMLWLTSESSSSYRCLKYSWLGPDSITLFGESELSGNDRNSLRLSNRTCKEFPKPRPIPCVTPFLVTEQGYGFPDPREIERGFRQRNEKISVVECDPGEGNTCVEVAFYFSNRLVNQSAYCARVSENGHGLIKEGCVTSQNGAYTNKVCVCDPADPNNRLIPCNSGLLNDALGITPNKMFIIIVVACLTALIHVS